MYNSTKQELTELLRNIQALVSPEEFAKSLGFFSLLPHLYWIQDSPSNLGLFSGAPFSAKDMDV
jgi:hypothetical protein